METNRQEN